jgi:hypothetical protein
MTNEQLTLIKISTTNTATILDWLLTKNAVHDVPPDVRRCLVNLQTAVTLLRESLEQPERQRSLSEALDELGDDDGAAPPPRVPA